MFQMGWEQKPLGPSGIFSLITVQTESQAESFFVDQVAVQRRYYQEICQAIQQVTGADDVLAFHHNVRHQRENLEGTSEQIGLECVG